MIHESAFVHPLAHVDSTASVGAGSKIWQFASVIRGASLGSRCNVASGATLDGCVFGDDVIVCHNVAMGPGFKIGNGVFIGPNVTFCNDAWPRAHKDGFNPHMYDGTRWAVIVEGGASIGANSVILPGVVIGAGAMIAGGSRVTKSVPPHHLWVSSSNIVDLARVPTKERMRFADGEAHGNVRNPAMEP